LVADLGVSPVERSADAFGWQSLFYIGGVLPLGLSIVLIRAIPDSIEFLVMRKAANREIRDLLVPLSPAVNIPSDGREPSLRKRLH